VQWNGATLFDQSDIAAATWTNLQFLVTANTSSTLLQLGFQDDPSYLGLDDVSLKAVTNAASTTIKSTLRTANDFHLNWNTTPGVVYQLQYKTNLFQADWINFGGPVSAAGSTLLTTDPNAFQVSPRRFYRLVVVP
jgi:hypothetical protein